MPALTLFGRAWRFGSDDFTFPGLGGALLRGSWLIILCIVFGISYHDIPECNEGKLAKVYFWIMIPLLFLEFFLEIIITAISMRGTVMDTTQRSSITKFIYIRLAMFIPEFGLTLMGSIWIFNPGVDCDTEIVWSIRVLVGCQWAVLIIVLIFLIILFNPMGRVDSSGKSLVKSSSAFQKAIETQLENTCCCSGGSGNQSQAFSDIARGLAIVFHDVDLVPSDIAAGLILLNQEQSRNAQEDREASRQWVKDRLVTSDDMETWEKFDESYYFYHFALGSYGWPLYCYMHLCCGLCHLCKVCKCGCSQNLHGIVIEGDECCKANTSGLISQGPAHGKVEYVFSSFKNDVYQTAFCVCIDHQLKKVVISVRGTLSLKDVLTDLTAETDSLELDCDDGCEEKCSGHRGMTKSAKFIRDKLERENILESLFLRYPEYHLVIVGHSLGAGTSAILAILMKKKYETVKCFAYSPPQALNLKAAKYCEDFVTSVVVGNDVISRLSIHSVDILKKEIIDALKHCQMPKYQILLGGCWGILSDYICSCTDNAGETSHLLAHDNNVVYNLNVNTQQTSTSESETAEHFEKLYCPGNILHLIERKSMFDLIHGDRDSFDKIAIVPNMISNHVPDNVKKAYDVLLSQIKWQS
ncbi:sn1-specific diacylglycerol lipase beta-like [Dendronephthya gigantea]|uniref:sn1-specific diacylglycerol lipase beta-like n=1 Tax=Dendronephthya gigantea TaxID=151771 RepID=UPI00106A51D5|nr:sn1-specific diacylglycerol lipase beta-like [Dendronephthya gigantea]